MSGQSVATSSWTEHPYPRGACDRCARSTHGVVDEDGDGDGDDNGNDSLG